MFWGHEAQIGYFPQDVGSTIEHGLTVAEWLHRWNPAAHVEEIRGILGQMLFSGEEGEKQTKALSGGEQARLVFCKLILTKPNILIFDEPTNHLDLEVDQRAEHRAAEVRGNGAAGDARSRPDR